MVCSFSWLPFTGGKERWRKWRPARAMVSGGSDRGRGGRGQREGYSEARGAAPRMVLMLVNSRRPKRESSRP